MSEARITEAVRSMRGDLAKREREALEQMDHAYAGITNRLGQVIAGLEDELEAILEAGEVPTIGRLYRMERYRALIAQSSREFARFGRQIGTIMDGATREAVRQAERDAGELTKISLGPPPPGVSAEVLFTHMPHEALTEIVGATRSGPLAELLEQFGALAAHDARSSLILGIALGEHPSKVARRVRDALGIPLHRARTIARTEQLRAYREGHRRWYEANDRIVKEWIWHSARGRNTCVACWAMHGTRHPLNEPMGTHPNCRCAMVPVTRTWAELGLGTASDASPASITPGAELFARLKPTEQLHILGPKAYAAYHDGAVEIGDFVHARRSRDWGVTRSRGSLARALIRAEGR